jgi:N utilization substance protein B
MASPVPSQIRRLAFQLLFQLDAVRTQGAQGTVDDDLFEGDDAHGLSPRDQRRASELATSAFQATPEADVTLEELAPKWPPRRQPAVDRALLRLAHYEMTSGRVPPKVVINEAVDLAKVFGTERSPAFINGVLDALAKRVKASIPNHAVESAQAPESSTPAPTE